MYLSPPSPTGGEGNIIYTPAGRKMLNPRRLGGDGFVDLVNDLF